MLDNEFSIGKSKILIIELNICHTLLWFCECYECIIFNTFKCLT